MPGPVLGAGGIALNKLPGIVEFLCWLAHNKQGKKIHIVSAGDNCAKKNQADKGKRENQRWRRDRG